MALPGRHPGPWPRPLRAGVAPHQGAEGPAALQSPGVHRLRGAPRPAVVLPERHRPTQGICPVAIAGQIGCVLKYFCKMNQLFFVQKKTELEDPTQVKVPITWIFWQQHFLFLCRLTSTGILHGVWRDLRIERLFDVIGEI